jgi:hypothetical protein
MTPPRKPIRWDAYVLEQGSGLERFWRAHLGERQRDVLIVLGKGFDPRMCVGLQMLLHAGGIGRREVAAMDFAEGPSSPSAAHADRVTENWRVLNGLVKPAAVRVMPVKVWSADGRRIGSFSASKVFKNADDFAGYTDVVLDLSAMPRSVAFPLIAKALHLIDGARAGGGTPPNLHLLVCEDPALDGMIHEEGIEDTAAFIHGFTGSFDREATAGEPKVWVPLLGERQKDQLAAIYDLVKPDEICPVLPSPSLDPRRGDRLVLEYRDLLLDQLGVEPRNFIYASERNPFEAYRQIRRTVEQYRDTLSPLGGSKFALSALSSKLLSVAALLVAYELRSAKIDVGIAHVDCHGYTIDDAATPAPWPGGELFGLWLAGEFDEP